MTPPRRGEKTSRRRFLKGSTALGFGVWVAGNGRLVRSDSPNERLNIAAIGVGGKGRSDISACSSENIVALCDPDEARAAESFARYPKAKRYRDYRKMLEERKDTDRPGKFWKQPLDRPADKPPVRKHLNWDLWLGPAPTRSYHPVYVPHDWRAWWDFGTGALGDMACHVADTAFWALELGSPASVEAEVPWVHPETAPAWEVITYQFPSRGNLPPVTLKWYDAGAKPPQEWGDGKPLASNGALLIGDQGTLYAPEADQYVHREYRKGWTL